MAQAWLDPAAISLNAPCGGEDWPSELIPQHAIVASWRSPHVKCRPADIWVKAVWAGASRLPASCGSPPQQRAAPFSRRAQTCVLPMLICVKGTFSGGVSGLAGVGAGVGWVVGVGGKGVDLGGKGVAVRVGGSGVGDGGAGGRLQE